jgi:hypothetical protein
VEHARSCGGDRGLDARVEELLERRHGSVRLLRERPSERAGRLVHPLGEERALIERTEIPARLGRDEGEHIVELAGMHG